jgi:uncharacterized protein (TIGR03118 family)
LFAPTLGVLALCLALAPLQLAAQAYMQTNLVSDIPGLAANTDSRLVNPWGMSASGTSPLWVSDANTGLATLYNGFGAPQPLVVTIPGAATGAPGVPTGQVFNTAAGSGAFNGDLFIFASATGFIAGWRGALGTTAEKLVDNSTSGASYLGVALGTTGGNSYLYAANFVSGGHIDVFPNAGASPLTGSFLDPGLPTGYTPFNVQNIGGTLFVQYALLGADGDEVKGPGLGIVDRFNLNGDFLNRFATGGVLDAPWGVALAPASFGPFGGNLLVGNFGDGTINAFDFSTGAFRGTIRDAVGNPLVNEGLWGISFGNTGAGSSPNTLYINAGIADETHGLLAAITAVPEAGTTGVFAGLGLIGLCAAVRLRRAKKTSATL